MALCCLRIFSFLFSWSKDMPITLGNTDITSSTGNLGVAGTGSLVLPAGTTAQRPATAATGMQRFNTSTNTLEFYNGTAWVGIGLQDGLTEGTAAPSATYIKTINPAATNGIYWIKPAGTATAFQVYCDMTYDGGAWIMAFAYHKGQPPVSDVANYFQSPQAAATGSSLTLAQVARVDDPLQSFVMPESFFTAFGSNNQGRGEVREEYAISGGTWPNNTNRVVIFHGGRTSGGAAGNFLTSTQMANARTVMGFNGRNAIAIESTVGNTSRSGYLKNTLGVPSPYTGGNSSILGISVDPNNLGAPTTTDGTNSYTNQQATAGSSWMGRGTGYSAQGSSTNGGEPNGTRWGFVFIR
jgi:hypothetical protein